MTNDDKARLLTIINIELTFRKALYPQKIEQGEMDRSEANHRFLCLETARYMLDPLRRMADPKELRDVLEEIDTWCKEIQRDATPATMRADGQRIKRLTAFIKYYSPAPEQGRVVQTELF